GAMSRVPRTALLVAGLCVGAAGPGRGADAPPPGWYSTSGLSFVMAAGNSRASTLGFKAELKRLWPRATFSLAGSGVRADANDPARLAVGTPTDFRIETGTRVLKAANYNAAAVFDRRLSDLLGRGA